VYIFSRSILKYCGTFISRLYGFRRVSTLRLFMLLVLLDTAPVLYLALGFPKGEAITWRGKLAVTLLTVAYDVFLIFLAYHASFSLERSATLLYNPELLVSAFFFTFLSGAALTFLLIDLAGYCDPKRLWKLWNSYMRCITILAIVGLFLKLIL